MASTDERAIDSFFFILRRLFGELLLFDWVECVRVCVKCKQKKNDVGTLDPSSLFADSSTIPIRHYQPPIPRRVGSTIRFFLFFLVFFLFFFFFLFFSAAETATNRINLRRRLFFFCLSICVLSLFYFVSFLFFSRVCPPSLRVWSVVIESVIERRFLLPTAPDCWGRLEIDVWRRLYSFTGFYRVFFSSASLAASIIWSMLIESVIDCWSLLWIHLWWHLYSFIWLLKFALNWCSMALIESLDWIELVFSFWSHLIAEVCSWLILDGVCAVEPDCWSLLLIDVRLRQYSFTGFLPSLFFFSHSHCFHVWSVSIEFVIEVVFCWWSYLIAEVGTLWGSLITGFYRVFISAAVRWSLLLLSPLIGMRFNP